MGLLQMARPCILIVCLASAKITRLQGSFLFSDSPFEMCNYHLFGEMGHIFVFRNVCKVVGNDLIFPA